MLDPFPPPPLWLKESVEPWATYFRLATLPEHVHEILFAFAFYLFIQFYLSPRLSTYFFPQFYLNFPRRTQLNWDVHVVSFVQSTLITILAIWITIADQERWDMTSGGRVYGYTGACGLIQALATGYFLYDLVVSTLYFDMFGVGMFFHAISALWVYSQGFRPFVNFYAPTFILYELSSPFLNIHWFLDKVNMTGSKAQWYNGILLLFVFFSCRLVWGTWKSLCVYMDMWKATSQIWRGLDPIDIKASAFQLRHGTLCIDEACADANAELSRFSHQIDNGLPWWLSLTYVVSNIVLNGLNYYWFSKMIETVLKRFRDPDASSKRKEKAGTVKGKNNINATAKSEEGDYFEANQQVQGKNPLAVSDDVDEVLRRRKA